MRNVLLRFAMISINILKYLKVLQYCTSATSFQTDHHYHKQHEKKTICCYFQCSSSLIKSGVILGLGLKNIVFVECNARFVLYVLF